MHRGVVAFSFHVNDPKWAAFCLTGEPGRRVRVLFRDGHERKWCLAQAEDGEVGLLPTVLLQRDGGSEVVPPKRAAKGINDREPVMSGATKEVSQRKGNVNQFSRASLCTRNATAHDTKHSGDCPQDDSQCGGEVGEVIACYQHRQRSLEENMRETHTAAVSAAMCTFLSPSLREDEESRQLLELLLQTHAECHGLTSATGKVDSALQKLEAESAHMRQQANRMAKECSRLLHETSNSVAQKEAAIAEAKGLLCEVLQRSFDQWDAGCFDDRGGFAMKEKDIDVDDVSIQCSHVDGGENEEAMIRQLIRREKETLEDYHSQEDKLNTRKKKLDVLLQQLDDESALLNISEAALEAIFTPCDPPIPDIPPAACASERGPLLEADVGLRDGAEWPRMLNGLTSEEADALTNYVRLYDKYIGKRNKLLEADQWDDEPCSRGADKQQPVSVRVQRLRERLLKGDAACEDVEREIGKLRQFCADYNPAAKRLEEQLKIGERLLTQKMAQLQQLKTARTR